MSIQNTARGLTHCLFLLLGYLGILGLIALGYVIGILFIRTVTR